MLKIIRSVEKEAVLDKRLPNTTTQSDHPEDGNFPNPFYEHIAIIHTYLQYIVEYQHQINGTNIKLKRTFLRPRLRYNVEKIIDSVSVEVGLFVGNLGYYLLEEGLDISYNSCFKREVKDWHNVGLHMVEQRPITMISCGYAKRYRRQDCNMEQKYVIKT